MLGSLMRNVTLLYIITIIIIIIVNILSPRKIAIQDKNNPIDIPTSDIINNR
jgi:hypothetical protein